RAHHAGHAGHARPAGTRARQRAVARVAPAALAPGCRPLAQRADVGERERSRRLELVVVAVLWILVRPPPAERGAVPESVPLEMVERDFRDEDRLQRDPRDVLPLVPTARPAGRALETETLLGRRLQGPQHLEQLHPFGRAER